MAKTEGLYGIGWGLLNGLPDEGKEGLITGVEDILNEKSLFICSLERLKHTLCLL